MSVKKLNVNEPLMICRKGYLLTKLLDLCTDRKTVTGNCLLVTGQPALRRQELYTGSHMKRGKLLIDAQKSFAKNPIGSICNSIPTSRKKQLTVTDEVVVVMILMET